MCCLNNKQFFFKKESTLDLLKTAKKFEAQFGLLGP
jgi:hypothetical protein